MRNPVSRGRFTFNLGRSGENAPLLPTSDEGTRISAPAGPPPPAGNRKQRRRQAVFTQQLARRLEKDKVPVKIETLPDGGLHVTADMRDEKP